MIFHFSAIIIMLNEYKTCAENTFSKGFPYNLTVVNFSHFLGLGFHFGGTYRLSDIKPSSRGDGLN